WEKSNTTPAGVPGAWVPDLATRARDPGAARKWPVAAGVEPPGAVSPAKNPSWPDSFTRNDVMYSPKLATTFTPAGCPGACVPSRASTDQFPGVPCQMAVSLNWSSPGPARLPRNEYAPAEDWRGWSVVARVYPLTPGAGSPVRTTSDAPAAAPDQRPTSFTP